MDWMATEHTGRRDGVADGPRLGAAAHKSDSVCSVYSVAVFPWPAAG
jgi:hypothetical protein